MGPKGAVEIIFAKQIGAAENPSELKDRLIEEYTEKFANPYIAAERGYVDEVIEPRFTRPKLISAMTMLQDKVDANPLKKHGNIPL